MNIWLSLLIVFFFLFGFVVSCWNIFFKKDFEITDNSIFIFAFYVWLSSIDMLQYHRKRTTQKNGNAWDLESIKQAHPEAARRVAISIISNAVEGITFDRYSYDSKSIWITTLLNNDKYHWLMIAISFLHCNMGFLGKKANQRPFSLKNVYM